MYGAVPPLAVTHSSPPRQTSFTEQVGFSLTVSMNEQSCSDTDPLSSVTTTEYVPASVSCALVIVIHSSEEVKPFGPVQL